MKKPIVSVVVPIYKAEAYLRDCVDSILHQTMRYIEVLLVDDGSPDGCGAICDEYVERDKRVRVFHRDNGGVSVARKVGVDNAIADWITFVDADDTLPATALADLCLYREKGNDIIIGRFDDKEYSKEILTVEENRSLALAGTYIHCSLCARLIARHLFRGINFPPPELPKGEDMLTNIQIAFANGKRVRLVSKKVYNYDMRQGSVIHSFQNSVEYEMKFAEYRNGIIPRDQWGRYDKEIVMNSLASFEDIYRTHRRNVWYGTPYYTDVMRMAKRCGYQIPLSQRIKLRITNTVLLRLYVMGESFISYRYKRIKATLK